MYSFFASSRLEKKIAFNTNEFGNHEHYVLVNQLKKPLEDNDIETLSKIFYSFPKMNMDWVAAFDAFNPNNFSKDLIEIAANAYDSTGFTMLNLATLSAQPAAVQKLIEFGADVNAHDRLEHKHALHWTIDLAHEQEQRYLDEAKSIAKYLLNHGADIQVCHRNLTITEYARQKDLIEFAEFICSHAQSKLRP